MNLFGFFKQTDINSGVEEYLKQIRQCFWMYEQKRNMKADILKTALIFLFSRLQIPKREFRIKVYRYLFIVKAEQEAQEPYLR